MIDEYKEIVIPCPDVHAHMKPVFKTLLGFDINEQGETRVQVNTTNEAHLALALRRMAQVVDLYMAEQELKREAEAKSKIVTAPASVLDRLTQ